MIRVAPQPEPADFAKRVRHPGHEFLRQNPRPTSKSFEKHSFWRDCLPQLRTSYGGICAYSSIWMPAECSVDHFFPKVLYPHLAYDWHNYRLALRRINKNKADSLDVLDPFLVPNGWFILDPATLWVRAESGLTEEIINSIARTIEVLKLNDDPLVEIRFELFDGYKRGELSITFLERKYPFLAAEIRRQGIDSH